MKKLAIVWGITVLLVFGGLTFFGFKYQEIKEYKITLAELKAFRPKVDFNVENDSCDGKVIVTKVFWGYSYKASLKCKKY